MVQVSEATAYAAPKPIMEAQPAGQLGAVPDPGGHRRAPRRLDSSRRSAASGRLSSHTPSRTTITPMTTVTQGR